MHSFYTIVSLSPNIATKDSVGVGLVLFDGNRFQYYFSDRKRMAAQKLISNPDLDLKGIFKQIEGKCEELNRELIQNKLIYSAHKWMDASYFEYLEKYSNGLVQFSAPKAFIVSGEADEFEKLVRMLFNENLHEYITVTPPSRTQRLVEEKLIKRVSDKVHVNYKFTPSLFPSIHFKYELDCIGKNGFLVGAKSLEFNQSSQTLDLKMSHYYSLILMLASKHNKPIKGNNFFLLAEEPKSVSSSEHKLWASAQTNPLVQVLNPEESSKVADLIEDKLATKFLEEVEF